jgi:phage tail protein X
MIWLKRRQGEPFALTLSGLGPLEGATVRAAARDRTGSLWPFVVTVTDPASGGVEIDGRTVGRVWPAGLYVMDLRLMRAGLVALTRTFGIAVRDPEAAAEDARRVAAPLPGPGQRRVWTDAGEVLDALCRRELGAEAGVATAYGLNPGLAALGPILPSGTGILLPEAPPTGPAPRRPVRLWGAS